MKAHIGVDASAGLVHSVTATAANEADINQTEHLLHGEEKAVFADASYTGAEKSKAIAAKAPGAKYYMAQKPRETGNPLRSGQPGAGQEGTVDHKPLMNAKTALKLPQSAQTRNTQPALAINDLHLPTVSPSAVFKIRRESIALHER